MYSEHSRTSKMYLEPSQTDHISFVISLAWHHPLAYTPQTKIY